MYRKKLYFRPNVIYKYLYQAYMYEDINIIIYKTIKT